MSAPRIVLGVSGGIAAYKAIELCRRLVDAGFFVSPIMTAAATNFVGPATFAALASEPPRLDLWSSPEPSPHTVLGQQADLVIVAPATARIIASYAHGLSDDLLATTLLATRAPVMIAPAMHTEMWENPAVQDNIALLRSRGVVIVDPEVGHLAGGDNGVGRLASVDTIFNAAESVLSAKSQRDLVGKRVLITAGGTREPIDPVRFLGNRSSGKQGHALATAARERGADVTLITTASSAIDGVTSIAVETAQQMHDAVLEHLDKNDVLIMAAAVADFRPAEAAEQKLKKHDGIPQINLVPTADILSAVAEKKRGQIVVGFAAETVDPITYGRSKLLAKDLDAIVINDVSAPGAGFEHETNSVTILDRSGGEYTTGVQNKRTVSHRVLDTVVNLSR